MALSNDVEKQLTPQTLPKGNMNGYLKFQHDRVNLLFRILLKIKHIFGDVILNHVIENISEQLGKVWGRKLYTVHEYRQYIQLED